MGTASASRTTWPGRSPRTTGLPRACRRTACSGPPARPSSSHGALPRRGSAKRSSDTSLNLEVQRGQVAMCCVRDELRTRHAPSHGADPDSGGVHSRILFLTNHRGPLRRLNMAVGSSAHITAQSRRCAILEACQCHSAGEERLYPLERCSLVRLGPRRDPHRRLRVAPRPAPALRSGGARRLASGVSWCRVDSCSLRSTEETWLSTVLTEMNSSPAISL